MHERSNDLRIPVVQEELEVAKRVVETGRLRVHTHVSERQEVVELPLEHEEFTVERIAIGRPVDAPLEVRQEGDVTIVPVHEEEIVVSRRLVLKEELHIRRAVHRTQERHEVTLRREDVDVSRAPPAPADAPMPRH